MKVLIVGGGGREHTIALKIAENPQVTKLYAAPGNGGMASICECLHYKATDVAGIREQLTHGKTGWIVENERQAICDGLRYLLQNPEIRLSLKDSSGMDAICRNEEKYNQFFALCSNNT